MLHYARSFVTMFCFTYRFDGYKQKGVIMEQDLISKKELLELTGISYGQLYRWKRERLLPEDWFIKRSAFTGQETFFPRTQMLERISAIKELKDSHSLDDIAVILSPQVGGPVPLAELKEILDTDSLFIEAVVSRFSDSENNSPLNTADKAHYLSFSEVVFIGALGSLVDDKTLTSSAAAHLAFSSRTLALQWASETMSCEVLAIQDENDTNAVSSWHLALFKEGAPPAFSNKIQIVTQLPLDTVSAAIKQTLSDRAHTFKEVTS